MGQVLDLEQLTQLRPRWRDEQMVVVFTNGHFDLLHTGHLHYLQQARTLGDLLIVGINDDATTTARKGPRRPILPERERAELVAGLACVDFATIFREPTAHTTIQHLEPDIYVKGGDYTLDPDADGVLLPEAETVFGYGGKVQILPEVAGQSTSAIEQRIIERWQLHGRDAS